MTITKNGVHPSTVMHGKVKSTKAVAPAQGAETKTTGSTAEEQKGIAHKFYGKRLGLRGKPIETE